MKQPTKQKTLNKLSGTLLLVGAGKMGSAMLDGWLARGLKPRQLSIVEPQPHKSIKALARRCVTLNAKPGRDRHRG
jgi:pyrroline-5-carboxylate reductase